MKFPRPGAFPLAVVGDVAGGADFAPNDATPQLVEEITRQVAAMQADYHKLVEKDVPVFNRLLAEHGITPVTSGIPGTTGHSEKDQP